MRRSGREPLETRARMKPVIILCCFLVYRCATIPGAIREWSMDDGSDEDQEHVMGLLAPYLDRMLPIFAAAVELYNKEVSSKARAEQNSRAIANAVWCHVWAGFQREFLDMPGCHFLDRKGLQVLNIQDAVSLRAKKVDKNGRHQNADTPQQRAFDTQMELPGFPPAAARIVMGYQPDEAFSLVERVIVRRPQGRWVSQVVDAEVNEKRWIEITPAELPFFERRRDAR